VLARVVEHVRERVANLARRAQDVLVITVAEESAPSPPQSVQALRDADREPVNAARERAPIARLADQVDVIALRRVVHDPKTIARARERERFEQDRVLAPTPQRRPASSELQRHMHRKPRRHRSALAMRDARSLPLRLATRAAPPPAPTVGEVERRLLPVASSSHTTTTHSLASGCTESRDSPSELDWADLQRASEVLSRKLVIQLAAWSKSSW
jgi:hypothetical protein